MHRIRSVCFSNIGKRSNQEDNFYLNGSYMSEKELETVGEGTVYYSGICMGNEISVYAVSDGMGGHNAGEIASMICVSQLAEKKELLDKCTTLEQAVELLQNNISETNGAIWESGSSQSGRNGMGATLVILAVCGNKCAVINVGDSRAYYFDGKTLTQITIDNNEGQRLLKLGLLTRKEVESFPDKNNLSRYMGYRSSEVILRGDEYYFDMKGGIVMLCSDGISDYINVDIIERILKEKDIKLAGQMIINDAVKADNADNATIILVAGEED